MHASSIVVHEVIRSGPIRPSDNRIGYEVVDRDEMNVEADHYFECALCHAAEHEVADLFVATSGTAT